MGLRSAMVFCAGGILANFVLVPLVWFLGSHINVPVYPGTMPVSAMTAAQIYASYVRFIGVGAIATAGIFGVIKSLRVIAGSFSIALRAFHSRATDPAGAHRSRHLPARDSSRRRRERPRCRHLLLAFSGLLDRPLLGPGAHAALRLLLCLGRRQRHRHHGQQSRLRHDHAHRHHLVAWCSCTSASPATTGMFFVMAIAGMVCTALCVSGQFITDLKTGYWLGNTPAAQEKVKFIGVLAAAAAAGLTIVLLAHTFQFGEAAAGDTASRSRRSAGLHHEGAGGRIHEPPARHLSSLRHRRAHYRGAGDAWQILHGLRARHLPAARASPRRSSPAASSRTSSIAARRKPAAKPASGIRERGVILASGLMAGGALGGVLGAALRLLPWFHEDFIQTPFYPNDPISQSVSALLFIGLCVYVWFGSLRKEKQNVMNQLENYVADAVLGIDTLWGGDVMCPSGTGRFIADSWFSDEPLPAAYTHPAAALLRAVRRRVRQRASTAMPSKSTCAKSNLPAAIAGLRKEAASSPRTAPRLSRGPRASRSKSCGTSPWKFSARAIRFPTRAPSKPRPRKPPEPSHPEAKRERVAELLGRAGHSTSRPAESSPPSMPGGATASRPWPRCKLSAQAVIAHFDALSAKNLVPHLPQELAQPCPAPTSTSCPSRTHGSPGR